MARPPKTVSPSPAPAASAQPSTDRLRGEIIRRVEDRGFGFILEPISGEEYFFHQSDLENVDFLLLADRQEVSFVPKSTPKGPRATAVRVIAGG